MEVDFLKIARPWSSLIWERDEEPKSGHAREEPGGVASLVNQQRTLAGVKALVAISTDAISPSSDITNILRARNAMLTHREPGRL
jgi:hypothetical protein